MRSERALGARVAGRAGLGGKRRNRRGAETGEDCGSDEELGTSGHVGIPRTRPGLERQPEIGERCRRSFPGFR